MSHYFIMDAATIVNLDTGAEFCRNPETGDVQLFFAGRPEPNTAHGALASALWQRLLGLAERDARAISPAAFYYAEPTCEECGQSLSSADVARGERVCLECAPLVVEVRR